MFANLLIPRARSWVFFGLMLLTLGGARPALAQGGAERWQRCSAQDEICRVPGPATVQTVWRSLTTEIPSLEEYERTLSVAINAEYSRMAAAVQDGDEVAFLPPVSGG